MTRSQVRFIRFRVACVLAIAAHATLAQEPLFIQRTPGRHPLGPQTAALGDINKDGYADFAVSGSYVRALSGKDGKEFYRLQQRAWIGFGFSLAAVGDIDKDGISEFAVGAPGVGRSSRPYAGVVLVFSGKTGKQLFITFGLKDLDEFGYSVGPAGDQDRDGVPDLVAGAPQGLAGARGYVHVISGKTGKRIWALQGAAAGDYFGWSVSGGSDLDKDGYPDTIVGAPRAKRFGAKRFGAAFAYSGRTGRLLHVRPGFIDPAKPVWSWTGQAVVALPDINGDKHGDYLVTGDLYANVRGYALIVSGKTGSILRTIIGEHDGDRLGMSAALVGDIDGDGSADVAIGAPQFNVAGSDYGRVYVVSARDGRRIWTKTGESKHQEIGYSVGAVGDTNGDKVPDVVATSLDSSWSEKYGLWILSGKALPLSSDLHHIPSWKGGVARFTLRAGQANAGAVYLLLGSASGVFPGVRLFGANIPLNIDPYFWVTASTPNSALLYRTLGRLDGKGNAVMEFRLPKLALQWHPSLHHAAIVFSSGTISFVSNSVILAGG